MRVAQFDLLRRLSSRYVQLQLNVLISDARVGEHIEAGYAKRWLELVDMC